MTRFFSLVFLISIFVHSAAATAHAQGPLAGKGNRQMRADTDGDGRISLKEFLEARQAKAMQMFQKLDTNSDGYLSREELQAGRAQRKALRSNRGAGQLL